MKKYDQSREVIAKGKYFYILLLQHRNLYILYRTPVHILLFYIGCQYQLLIRILRALLTPFHRLGT